MEVSLRALSVGLSCLLAGCSLLVPGADDFTYCDASCDRIDAGQDGGGVDSGVDAGFDAGDVDAGEDAGPRPSECATPADCGGGDLVQCLAGRCVACISPLAEATQIRATSQLRPNVALAIQPQPTGPAVVLIATHGMTIGTPAQLHRYEIESPTAATALDLEAPISAAGTPCDSRTAVTGLALATAPGRVGASIGVIARNSTSGMVTNLNWDPESTFGEVVPAGYTCRSLTPPADILGGTALVTTTRFGLPIEMQVTRELSGAGSARVSSYEFGFAFRRGEADAPASVSDYAEMSSMGRWAILASASQDEVLLFDPEATLSRVSTPGRSGDASGVAVRAGNPGDYLIAYPVENRVRVVTLECDDRCRAVGASVDFAPGRTVEAARVVLVDNVLALLTVEQLSMGRRALLLRLLRDDRQPFDAPGGGTETLVEMLGVGDVVADVELAATAGPAARYVAAWAVVAGASTSVRTRPFNASCR